MWGTPAIVLGTAAPAHAVSPLGTLLLQADRVTGGFRITVTNTGSGTIPAGGLTLTVILQDHTPKSTFAGYTSDGNWVLTSQDATTEVFTYQASLAPKGQTGFFVVLFNPGGPGTYARLQASAPGYTTDALVVQLA